MEEFFQELFRDTNGDISDINMFFSEYLPVLIYILIAAIVIHFVMGFIKRGIKKSKIPKSLHAFVAYGIRLLFYFLVIIAVCKRLGVDITSLIAAFSIVGVAVSLSIQNTLGNVMAGLSLLFTKQFDVDDYIDAGGINGTVMRIGLSCCKLRTPDGKLIYVPNSSIVGSNITNFSREPIRRVDITIGAPYNEDVDKVKNALQEVVNDTPQVLKEQPIFVGITAYGDSAIDYTIRVWVNNSEYWDAYLPMLEKVKRVFEREKIEIPFNQLDVHLKQG